MIDYLLNLNWNLLTVLSSIVWIGLTVYFWIKAWPTLIHKLLNEKINRINNEIIDFIIESCYDDSFNIDVLITLIKSKELKYNLKLASKKDFILLAEDKITKLKFIWKEKQNILLNELSNSYTEIETDENDWIKPVFIIEKLLIYIVYLITIFWVIIMWKNIIDLNSTISYSNNEFHNYLNDSKSVLDNQSMLYKNESDIEWTIFSLKKYLEKIWFDITSIDNSTYKFVYNDKTSILIITSKWFWEFKLDKDITIDNAKNYMIVYRDYWINYIDEDIYKNNDLINIIGFNDKNDLIIKIMDNLFKYNWI